MSPVICFIRGINVTARNWNTCQRMLRLLDELDPHPAAAT